jgi:hypothetical protein
VEENVSQIRLTKFEDLRTAIRKCFSDFPVNMQDAQKNMGEKLKSVLRMEESTQITCD